MPNRMNIALVGLPAREAAALTIFVGIGVGVKNSSCTAVAFRPGLALPPADLCVIDMAGIGLSQWSAKAEADLLTLLGGKNALLLLFPSNTSWVDKAQGHGRQMLHCLTKPYSSEDMCAALARLGSGAAPARAEPLAAPARWAAVARPAADLARPAAAMAAPAPTHASLHKPAAAPVHQVVLPAAAPLHQAASHKPAVALPHQAPSHKPAPAQRLPLQGSLQALRTMFPDLDRHLLLVRLLDLVVTERPQELRLTLHHSIVLHPGEGWVVHNAAPGMLERLAQDGSSVTTMSARELDSKQALVRAASLPASRASLDTFLWLLAESSFGRQAPSARRDAELQLRSIPGFTRLPGVENLFLQLAAICVRLPQTLSSLRAAFPEQDPLEISRFMLLSTVSGLGNLSLVAATAGAAAYPAPVARAVVRQESSGFFRAMLKKLF